MKKIDLRPLDQNVIAYCGVFCGGCPSYHVGTCHGCRSEEFPQKRTSKWKCRKRLCCLAKDFFSCGQCPDLQGCQIRKPLIKSYRLKYSWDLDDNAIKLKDLGPAKWLNDQIHKYCCPHCGGVISPYNLACLQCGYTKCST